MKFRTEVKTNFVGDLIHYKSNILAIGSCFADNIGGRLKEHEFSVVTNPFGIIFNPMSILNVLKNSLNQNIEEDLLIARDGHWFHFNYHSDITATSKQELISKISLNQSQTKKQLLESDVLMITFGTAWIYKYLKTQEIVANCHKIPQAQFKKELLDLDQLKDDYSIFFTDLFRQNKNRKIILTVSPVRHIKDGIHENNLSKSVLFLLSDYLEKKFDNVIYFPAYELIVDDLRDYRFYKEDLIHPTDQAIEYVYEKFSESYFSEKTKKAVELKSEIIKLEKHRFLNATDEEKKIHFEKIEIMKQEFDGLK